MTEQNAPEHEAGMGPWVLLGLLLAGCLFAYFLLAPRVAPVVVPFVTSNAS